MIPKSTVILSTVVVLLATVPAAVADSLPRINIEQLCSSRAKAMEGLSEVGGNALAACLRSEQTARAALVAAWNDIPPFYKATCIKPNDFAPSYEEWIACLELYIDGKILRSKK